MEHLLLRNVILENSKLDKLHLILDDSGGVVILPCLWMLHLANTGSVYGWHTVGYGSSVNPNFLGRRPGRISRKFEPNEVTDNTIDNYVGHFFHFLEYINNLNKYKGTPGVHNTELINSRLINHYLNKILPERLKSHRSLTAHHAAISAYFNFLYNLEIKDVLTTTVNRKTRQNMAEKDDRMKKINYISRTDRNLLLRSCNNQRDKLILRMGFEVGLRAEENTGLVLGKHKAKGTTHSGLLILFDEMEGDTSKNEFEFTLNGKYTKGGRTRSIFFDRELLAAMKNYYDTERKLILRGLHRTCNTLFIRTDNEGKGLPISAGQASKTFRIVKNRCSHLSPILSYHDARHTFATELYHSELLNPNGQETRSESAALLVIGERLGHKPGSTTTSRYIRLRKQMLIREEMK